MEAEIKKIMTRKQLTTGKREMSERLESRTDELDRHLTCFF